jgi:hypothetical protein
VALGFLFAALILALTRARTKAESQSNILATEAIANSRSISGSAASRSISSDNWMAFEASSLIAPLLRAGRY